LIISFILLVKMFCLSHDNLFLLILHNHLELYFVTRVLYNTTRVWQCCLYISVLHIDVCFPVPESHHGQNNLSICLYSKYNVPNCKCL